MSCTFQSMKPDIMYALAQEAWCHVPYEQKLIQMLTAQATRLDSPSFVDSRLLWRLSWDCPWAGVHMAMLRL